MLFLHTLIIIQYINIYIHFILIYLYIIFYLFIYLYIYKHITILKLYTCIYNNKIINIVFSSIVLEDTSYIIQWGLSPQNDQFRLQILFKSKDTIYIFKYNAVSLKSLNSNTHLLSSMLYTCFVCSNICFVNTCVNV